MNNTYQNHSRLFRQTAIILFWLAIWQTTAWLIHNPIILVGPIEALNTLFSLIPEKGFWLSVGHSFGKISLGFLLAFFLGIGLGSAAYRFPLIKEFLEPVMIFLKTIPVASFVILALIWAGSSRLSMVISFLVVLPMIYVNTAAGLEAADPKLLEMARVFHFSNLKKIRFIYFPALLPYLISGCKVSLGMSWKSGVAAEVIGVPAHSIGEHLYMSKVYLDTAGLFSWTFVIILVSALFEALFLSFLKRLSPKRKRRPL